MEIAPGAKGNCGLQWRVLIVGSCKDDFICRTAEMLGSLCVDFVRADDVYSAVGELVRNGRGKTIVVSRIEQLSREQGRFFHIARRNGCSYCCLADGSLGRMRRRAATLGLAAMGMKAFFVEEPAEVTRVLAGLLEDRRAGPMEGKEGDKTQLFGSEGYLTTTAELQALLGY